MQQPIAIACSDYVPAGLFPNQPIHLSSIKFKFTDKNQNQNQNQTTNTIGDIKEKGSDSRSHSAEKWSGRLAQFVDWPVVCRWLSTGEEETTFHRRFSTGRLQVAMTAAELWNYRENVVADAAQRWETCWNPPPPISNFVMNCNTIS